MATSVGWKFTARHPAGALRSALLGSVALACVAGASGGLEVRAATIIAPGYIAPGYDVGPPPASLDPNVGLRPVVRPKPKLVSKPGAKPVAKPDAKPDPKAIAKAKPYGKAEAAKETAPRGPLQIVVSIANQHVTLYSDGTRVAQGPVSTGVPGRPTPTGVFSVIQKDRFHHSNLYSNAPMPYMERITWSGVALHEGPLPGYPASHGCIRLTHDFAARLWGITKLGVRVIVARSEVTPVDFAHPRLFEPKPKPADAPAASEEPEKRAELAPVRLAQASVVGISASPLKLAPAGDATPPAGALRGTVDAPSTSLSTGTVAPAPATAPPTPPTVVAPPTVTAQPAVPTPPATSPTLAQAPSDAPKDPPKDPPKPASDTADPAKIAPAPVSPKALSNAEPPKHTGRLAVFISRREKKLYVRQDFMPVFDVPVEIDHPDQPFGTHVFTALELTDNGTKIRWNVMTMPSESRLVMAPKIGPKGHFEARATEPSYAPQTPAQVLDRIQIPQDAIDRISELLSPGASLVVSDQGLGPETGEGTDFIVLVR